jgi:hypothetical protein
MLVHPSSGTTNPFFSTLADSSIFTVPFCVHFSCFLVVYKKDKKGKREWDGKGRRTFSPSFFPFVCLFSFSQAGGIIYNKLATTLYEWSAGRKDWPIGSANSGGNRDEWRSTVLLTVAIKVGHSSHIHHQSSPQLQHCYWRTVKKQRKQSHNLHFRSSIFLVFPYASEFHGGREGGR